METKEFNMLFLCKHCNNGLIQGYESEIPKLCKNCGKEMIGYDLEGKAHTSTMTLSNKLTYPQAVEFSKSKHTLEEWQDWFSECGFEHGSNKSVVYEIFTKLVDNLDIPKEYQLPILQEIYISLQVNDTCQRYFKKALRAEPIELAAQRIAKNKEQLTKYINADNEIIVYRGIGISKGGFDNYTSLPLNKAVSFTVNRDKAVWFAQRFPSKAAIVYTAKIPITDVVFYTDENDEAEVIFIPKKGKTEDYIINTEDVGQRSTKIKTPNRCSDF